MTVIERSTFRNYFDDLIAHPERADENLNDVFAKLTETFTALASLMTDSPRDILIRGETIHIRELTAKEIKIFTEFAKKFLENHEVSEEQAEALLDTMIFVERGIMKLSEEGVSHGSSLKEDAVLDVRIAKKQILLHEKFQEETPAKDISIEAKNHIKRLLASTQVQAHQAEIKFDKAMEKQRNFATLSVGAVAGGVGLFAVSIALLAVGGPIAVGIIGLIGIGAFLGGFISLIRGDTNAEIKQVQKEYNMSIDKLERLESYKKLVMDEKFREFAADPANYYHQIRNDDAKFEEFLDRYHVLKYSSGK